jgi:hypothetical protein
MSQHDSAHLVTRALGLEVRLDLLRDILGVTQQLDLSKEAMVDWLRELSAVYARDLVATELTLQGKRGMLL